MPLTLEFVGSGDAFGSGGRFHSCTLLRSAAAMALVDCGASAPVALQKRGISPAEIGTIVLTHLHGDHFGGVPFLLLDAAFNRPRHLRLTVAGPAGVEEAVLRVYDALFPGTVARVREQVPVRYVELEPLTPVALETFEVTAYPVSHGSHVVSNALRISSGDRVAAFSSDTGWHPNVVEVSRNADVFVCECSGYGEAPPGHLSLDTLRAHAPEITARRVVLNHMGPEMVRHTSEAPWGCAEDGMVVEV